MSIDRLTAELRAGGTSEGEGGFSLDREKAREKLRQFQLADPHRYVLLFIQALVARGAYVIRVEIDADDVSIDASGARFTREDFDELYSSMYSTGQARPGLRELALASNAVMALNPRYVRVDSGDGREGARLELRVGQDDRIEPLTPARMDTRVHVKERFRPGLVVRFLRQRQGALREQLHLRERCVWADVAISLGEEPLSVGIARMLPGASAVASGALSGRLAFDPAGNVGVLFVVRYGVLIAQHELPHPQFAGARAVLVGDRMRTDASMSDVVRDAEYDAWVAALGVAHFAVQTKRLADALAQGSALPPVWRAVVRDRVAVWLSTTPAIASNSAYAPWLAVPLWQSLASKPVSAAQLCGRKGEIPITSEAPAGKPPKEVEALLHVTTDEDREALRRAFGSRVVDRTATVKLAVLRLANRDAWRRRPHAARLPDERSYSLRVPIAALGITGEVGLATDAAQRSFVRVLVDGCMLVELQANLGLAPVHAVVEGDFRPAHMQDAVVRDGKFAPAMLAVMASVDAIARSIAAAASAAVTRDESVERMLVGYLAAVVTDSLDVAALVSVGFDKKSAEKHVKEAVRPWRFDRQRDLAPDTAHPLARAPIAADAAGRPLALLDIASAFEREGFVRVIGLARPILREPRHLVVRAGESKLALLKSVFGEGAVKLIGTEFERWVARDERLEQVPERSLEIADCVVGPLAFTDGARQGVVGLRAGAADPGDTRATIAVWVDRRPMCEERIACGLPGVAVTIDVEPELADSVFKGIANREAFEQVGRSAFVGIAQLVPAVLQLPHGHAELPRVVLAMAQVAWPVPPMLLGWLALRRELGDTEGASAYAELLELLEQHAFHDVIAAMRQRFEQSVVPLPQMIGPGLPPRAQPVGVPWTSLRQAAAAQMPGALAIPCLATLTGSLVPLAHAVDAVAASTRVRWVRADAGHDPVPGFEDVLVLDPHMREALTAFIGDGALVDATTELELEARRRSFEQRAELSSIAIEPGRAIVRIELDAQRLQGELGIPLRPPRSAECGGVLVCYGRRPIHAIDPDEQLRWVGVVSGDFGLDSAFEKVSADDRRRIADLCQAQWPALLRAIIRAWPNVAAEDRETLRAWAQQLLRRVAAGTRGEPVALAERGISELATLPLFVDTTGLPCTLDALYVDCRAHGDVVYAREQGAAAERLVVLVRDDDEIIALREVFGSVRDYAEELARTAALAARLRVAAHMPRVPQDALAVFPVEGRGLVGQLWIDDTVNDETPIAFGRDGRVVGESRVSSMFPCRGAITGPGLDIAEDWSGFELSGPQQNQLKNDACSLWESLMHTAAKAERLDERHARPLRNLLLRLHAIPTARRKWPNHDQRKLYRELRQIPLLPLASGHSISLSVALRERPAELDRLGLWNPRERALKTDAPESASVPPPEPPPPESPPPESPPPEPPPPESPPAPVDPAERLLAAVRDELRLVRTQSPEVLAEIHLERMSIRELDGTAIASWQADALVLDRASKVVQHALREPDVLLVSILASATFTALNCALADVTDAHELDFLRWHAAHARTVQRS